MGITSFHKMCFKSYRFFGIILQYLHVSFNKNNSRIDVNVGPAGTLGKKTHLKLWYLKIMRK